VATCPKPPDSDSRYSSGVTLFGDTEFALRDQALGLVAAAYAEHLPQKVGTPPPS